MRRASVLVMILLLAGCGGDGEPAREAPFAVRPFDTTLDGAWIGNAVCYGPHRDGQRPGEAGPSAAELREDLHLIAERWKLLRIYSSAEFAGEMLGIIRDDALELRVVLGVWVSPDDEEGNRRERRAAVSLAAAYEGIVVAVSVGNETQIEWSAHVCPPEVLIDAVRRVRASVKVPVTVADDFNFWNKPKSRAVAAEIDFVTMHAHPMWNGQQLEEALPWLRRQVDDVAALHADRTVVVGETGWATSVHDEGEQARLIKGRPGETEQKAFHEAVTAWAADERRPVFFFEVFDENWKGGPHPAEVEKHWGLFRADRSPKAAMITD